MLRLAPLNRIWQLLKREEQPSEMDPRLDRELRHFMQAEYGRTMPAAGNYNKLRQTVRERGSRNTRKNRGHYPVGPRLSAPSSLNVTFASGRAGSAATMLVTVILVFKVVTALGQQLQAPKSRVDRPTVAYTDGRWAHMGIKSSDTGLVPGAPHRVEDTESDDLNELRNRQQPLDSIPDIHLRAANEHGF